MNFEKTTAFIVSTLRKSGLPAREYFDNATERDEPFALVVSLQKIENIHPGLPDYRLTFEVTCATETEEDRDKTTLDAKFRATLDVLEKIDAQTMSAETGIHIDNVQIVSIDSASDEIFHVVKIHIIVYCQMN